MRQSCRPFLCLRLDPFLSHQGCHRHWPPQSLEAGAAPELRVGPAGHLEEEDIVHFVEVDIGLVLPAAVDIVLEVERLGLLEADSRLEAVDTGPAAAVGMLLFHLAAAVDMLLLAAVVEDIV